MAEPAVPVAAAAALAVAAAETAIDAFSAAHTARSAPGGRREIQAGAQLATYEDSCNTLRLEAVNDASAARAANFGGFHGARQATRGL